MDEKVVMGPDSVQQTNGSVPKIRQRMLAA
jgi:hypothetical protein